MPPLRFDLAEAINQAITGIVTVVGVLVGGRIAFRYGLRQFREERKFDKRLALLEDLFDALNEFRTNCGTLLDMERTNLEKPGTFTEKSLSDALSEIPSSKNRLARLMRNIVMHGDNRLIEEWESLSGATETLWERVLQGGANAYAERDRLAKAERTAKSVESLSIRLGVRVREELGLGPPTLPPQPKPKPTPWHLRLRIRWNRWRFRRGPGRITRQKPVRNLRKP